MERKRVLILFITCNTIVFILGTLFYFYSLKRDKINTMNKKLSRQEFNIDSYDLNKFVKYDNIFKY